MADGDALQGFGRAARPVEERADERNEFRGESELALVRLPAAGENDDVALAELPLQDRRLAIVELRDCLRL